MASIQVMLVYAAPSLPPRLWRGTANGDQPRPTVWRRCAAACGGALPAAGPLSATATNQPQTLRAVRASTLAVVEGPAALCKYVPPPISWRTAARGAPLRRLAARHLPWRPSPAAHSRHYRCSNPSATAFGRAVPSEHIMLDYPIIILVHAVGAQRTPWELCKLIMVTKLVVFAQTLGALALGAAATPRRYRPSALHLTQEEGAWLTVTAWLRRATLHGDYKHFHIEVLLSPLMHVPLRARGARGYGLVMAMPPAAMPRAGPLVAARGLEAARRAATSTSTSASTSTAPWTRTKVPTAGFEDLRAASRGLAAAVRRALAMNWYGGYVAKAFVHHCVQLMRHKETMAPSPRLGKNDVRHVGMCSLALTSPTGRACNPVALPVEISRGPPTPCTRPMAGSRIAATSPTGRPCCSP